jgi:hypothetical protein
LLFSFDGLRRHARTGVDGDASTAVAGSMPTTQIHRKLLKWKRFQGRHRFRNRGWGEKSGKAASKVLQA